MPLDAAKIADEGLTPIPETAKITIDIFEARGWLERPLDR